MKLTLASLLALNAVIAVHGRAIPETQPEAIWDRLVGRFASSFEAHRHNNRAVFPEYKPSGTQGVVPSAGTTGRPTGTGTGPIGTGAVGTGTSVLAGTGTGIVSGTGIPTYGAGTGIFIGTGTRGGVYPTGTGVIRPPTTSIPRQIPTSIPSQIPTSIPGQIPTSIPEPSQKPNTTSKSPQPSTGVPPGATDPVPLPQCSGATSAAETRTVTQPAVTVTQPPVTVTMPVTVTAPAVTVTVASGECYDDSETY
ncbi:unnamed protein product [Tuber melanosporum]|jgi:hypothetical protein|uniref:(Perigord truffle) hypothetical protein n=1 Tax=Tuber melanosporum (strain Mel28) TaxID=656061 RepID=D5GIL3_TUBMM|nr:uncharacterized protein GSTUM_00008549001 [Tuber melanosporum]CAZ84356.1 unnamed protein product [Tuber melanosporum]